MAKTPFFSKEIIEAADEARRKAILSMWEKTPLLNWVKKKEITLDEAKRKYPHH